MKQLNQKDIQEIRQEILEKQKYTCPILKVEIPVGFACLDHAHEESEFSETKNGQIRGVLHKYANSLEGVFRSRFKRSGVANLITFEEFLLNLHIYLMEHRHPLLHPTNKPRTRKLQKRSYQELKREILEVNKFLNKPIKIPPYPKSGRLTKTLKNLFEQFGLIPMYYAKTVKS